MQRLVLFVCLSTVSACSAPSLAVVPRAGSFGLEGDLAAGDMGGMMNASSDFDSLGLDDDETVFAPRIDLDMTGLDFMLSALSADYTGSGTTDAEITIGGTTINQGVDVDSDMAFDVLSGAFTWDIIPTDLVDIGLGIGVSVLQFDVMLEDTLGGNTIESDETFPVPVLAGRVGTKIGPLRASATAGYLDVSIDDNDVALLDLDLMLSLRLFGGDRHGSGRLVAGYRMLDIDAEYEDDDTDVDADFSIEGPYVGLSFSL